MQSNLWAIACFLLNVVQQHDCHTVFILLTHYNAYPPPLNRLSLLELLRPNLTMRVCKIHRLVLL